MIFLKKFENFRLNNNTQIEVMVDKEEVFNEAHATLKPGSLIEFHIPDTNKSHVGKITSLDDTHITVIDLKTDKELRLPRKEFGPAYEN